MLDNLSRSAVKVDARTGECGERRRLILIRRVQSPADVVVHLRDTARFHHQAENDNRFMVLFFISRVLS